MKAASCVYANPLRSRSRWPKFGWILSRYRKPSLIAQPGRSFAETQALKFDYTDLSSAGSLLDIPGYDEATGIYYKPSRLALDIPQEPTLDDAKKAIETLNRKASL